MSTDFNSAQPVRTQTNGDVAVFIADGSTPSQVASVDASGNLSAKIRDASGNAITSQASGAQRALDVGINVAGVQIDPRSIRALTSTDVVTAAQGSAAATHASPWWVRLTDGTNDSAILATGELKVSVTQPLPVGTNVIGSVGVTNLPTTVDTNYGVAGASTIRSAAQLGNATGAANFNNGATGAQTLRVAANLAIAGADVTTTNPIPVTAVDSPGTPVNDYKDASAIAAAASDNHDYTVTAAKTLHLNQIECTASGKFKAEIQIETATASGVFNTRWVLFNSTSTPNARIILKNPIDVATGVRVRVIMTNKDNQAQDLYSTISGFEV